MPLTKSANLEIVDYLLSAEREGYEVTKVTERYPDLTIDDAYSLQKQLIERKVQDGVKRVGVKLGLTSKAKQEMMGVHEAIYGYLTSDMLGLEWEPIVFNQLIHPKAEPEIAFLMGEDLCGTNLTEEDVLKAVKYVAPALEIIDSRYLDFKFTLPDVVADNCSSSRFIVGSNWIKPDQVNLANIGMVMSKNGEVATVGAGAAVLGHPAKAVAWAVNKLGEHKEGLKKGDIVLTGAVSEAISFRSGDSIHAQFADLGSVSFSCS
ncbi:MULTISPECIES: 2-keto-4-pentenoate hydratase [Priestia]|jgi:2-oxo-3-hexenedioate decarboxylase|uniref:4-oxalocrotonate decarboxylase n=3 Tax=Priestia TaxID=2800373 RepID=D5E0U9_PRIM1|nr:MULTISPECIES: fumarylacetoacetate hydrolase family protein [Priestia]AVX09523.1 4-oxalocrotonate decarboxylase [Bacillus sp. Y-01]KOP75646.1 4-oxalocrotonate decarboxylase [Bacillus sp. FJAT-21351]KQU12838.1 4-oxalocrotonate decarboxylase [Bacillus sp. Leaf75]KRF56957.1 4-oxalocrotonate decarboxylase [Bacillus sp. Soil531]MDH6653412.1 2-oxo-3-hexenedioate decarboxylase [Bacillus sp. PvP124]MDP9576487.1 2-oxo-3-hexenedioate decarboxylase [Bacillus sp. 1751]MEB2274713.1 fumarylacetoacetate 